MPQNRYQFEKLKKQKLYRKNDDRSRKGSVDPEISKLVSTVNDLDNYFTTSSCAGRIVVYSLSEGTAKKGCHWLFVSHSRITDDQIKELKNTVDIGTGDCERIESIRGVDHSEDDFGRNRVPTNGRGRTVWIKFEGMILHVKARDVDSARRMQEVFIRSGFKNSGVVLSKNGFPLVACRGTACLQVPIAEGANIFANDDYINFLVESLNEKVDENFLKHTRLLQEIRREFDVELSSVSQSTI